MNAMARRIATIGAVIAIGMTVAACGAVQPAAPTPSPAVPTPVPTTVPPPPPRALGPGEQWVAVELWEPRNGVARACGGVGFVGEFRLHGSPTDPSLVWMTEPDGSRADLAWPLGYSARFTPGLELLDDTGSVVGREGSLIIGGCQIPDRAGVWWVELEPLAASESGLPATIPMIPRSAFALMANTQGRLAVRQGCLVIESARESLVPLWPSPGTQWDPATGVVTLDGVSARVGDEVVLGGGEGALPGAAAGFDWVSEPTPGCRAYPLGWLTWKLTVVRRGS